MGRKNNEDPKVSVLASPGQRPDVFFFFAAFLLLLFVFVLLGMPDGAGLLGLLKGRCFDFPTPSNSQCFSIRGTEPRSHFLHGAENTLVVALLFKYLEWWHQLHEPPRSGCLAAGHACPVRGSTLDTSGWTKWKRLALRCLPI